MNRRYLLATASGFLLAGCLEDSNVTPPDTDTPTETKPETATPTTPTGQTPTQPPTDDPPTVELDDPPRFVEHNFIDVEQVFSISKFRGFGGHDYSWGTDHGFLEHLAPETCRVMKHYVTVRPGILPWMPGELPLYAPVDGTIVNTHEWDSHPAAPIDRDLKFSIRSSEYPQIYFTFFHVDAHDGVAEGVEVAAGDELGAHFGPEIAVEIWDTDGEAAVLVPWFDVLTDEVFDEYVDRGVESRDDIYISREYRDANPFICANDSGHGDFIGKEGMTEEAFTEWSNDPHNTDLVLDLLPPTPRVVSINELMDDFEASLMVKDRQGLLACFAPEVYVDGVNYRDPPADGPTRTGEAIVDDLLALHDHGPPSVVTDERTIGFGMFHTVLPASTAEYYKIDFGETRRWLSFGFEPTEADAWHIVRFRGLE